jgi:hypothetical protein
MELVRELGIRANGNLEYASIFAEDGTILFTMEGETIGIINLPQNIRNLLKNEPIPKYNVIHNHASGESFSLADLEHLILYGGLKKIIAIGHNGLPYVMSIASGRVPSSQELKEVFNGKLNEYIDIIFDYKKRGIPFSDDFDLTMMSNINNIVREAFGWYYYDEVKK